MDRFGILISRVFVPGDGGRPVFEVRIQKGNSIEIIPSDHRKIRTDAQGVLPNKCGLRARAKM
jgi:hypothetical protein